MSKNETPTKVIVPCRFSYLHCWEPEAINGGEPKYSVSAIIPKSDKETIKKIQAAVEAAKQESLSKWGGKIPPNLKLPLRDGDIDRPEDEAYKGCYFFNANSRQAPQVVDKQVQPILDQTEVYSGCYGRISVNFYGYNSNGNRGVAAGLGITEPVNSPTFTIVQEYEEGRIPFYHFDVYRIGDVEEMDEIGYEDYFYGDGLCIIEWASLIEEIIPASAKKIIIEKDLEKGFDFRRITIEE